MGEIVINTDALPEALRSLIRSEKIKVYESDGEVRLISVQESTRYINELHGSLADYPEMSVSKFLERKYADMELEL